MMGHRYDPRDLEAEVCLVVEHLWLKWAMSTPGKTGTVLDSWSQVLQQQWWQAVGTPRESVVEVCAWPWPLGSSGGRPCAVLGNGGRDWCMWDTWWQKQWKQAQVCSRGQYLVLEPSMVTVGQGSMSGKAGVGKFRAWLLSPLGWWQQQTICGPEKIEAITVTDS